jgi:hypothetical protein
MLVRDGNDFLEVIVADRCTVVHAVGDTQFTVRVQVSNLNTVFAVESLCWVSLPELVAFAEQLRVLEERRQGSAVLGSMSPGELRLEIRTTDRAGHVAVVGQIGRWLGVGSGEPYWCAVAFQVPFCPTELPALVSEFSALAVALVA